MGGQWYCNVGGKETGPLEPQQLRALAESGGLAPGDRVRRGATGTWVRASQVKGLFAVPPPPPPAGSEVKAADVSLGGGVNLTHLDPAAHRSGEGIAWPSYARRRHQQQQRLIGSLVVVGAGVVVALLILIFGHLGGSGQDDAGGAAAREASPTTNRGATAVSQPDQLSAPPPAPAPRQPSPAKSLPVPAQKDLGGSRIKKADTERLRPPTGNPAEDFGIRPEGAAPPASASPPAKKPS